MTFKLRRISSVFLYLAFFLSFAVKGFALDKKISNALSHYIMAVIYDDLGDVDRAVQEYQQALRVENKNTVIHLNLAVSFIKKNEFKKAAEELDIAIKLDPESVEPHAIKALLYSLQNNIDESNREYELALKNASKLHPQDIGIYKNLGLLYLQQKKLNAAESIYRLILDLFPSDAQAHFYLANIYDQLDKKRNVEEELRKSLQLKPDYHEALNYLGYMYVEANKNLEEAENLIKKALELQPDNGAYVDSLGWLYFKKGNYKIALETLIRASTLLEDIVIYEHLGDVYYKVNDVENALANWQKSLKLDANQDKVKKKIEDLNKKTITNNKIQNTNIK